MTKSIKVEFAPGCFDSFTGTQEELNEIIAEITRMAETGELEENSRPVNLDEFDLDDECLDQLTYKRNLQ